MTPALSYTSKHLHSDVEKEKKGKLPKEFEEDKIKREEEKMGTSINIYKWSQYINVVHPEHMYCCNVPLSDLSIPRS